MVHLSPGERPLFGILRLWKVSFLKTIDQNYIKVNLVIRGLFICEFTFHIWNIDKKGQISGQNMSFYLRILYSRSKIEGRIYRE